MTNLVLSIQIIIGFPVITANVDTNHVYRFQKSCDLISWTDTCVPVTWGKPTYNFVDYTPTNPRCFYRVIAVDKTPQ